MHKTLSGSRPNVGAIAVLICTSGIAGVAVGMALGRPSVFRGASVALAERKLTYSQVSVEALRPLTAPAARVVRNEAEWKELLDAIGAESRPPSLDFSRLTVVALFAGERPTGGYRIQVDGVVEDPAKARKAIVRYRVVPPARDALVTQALTYPYIVIAIERKLDEIALDPPLASPHAK